MGVINRQRGYLYLGAPGTGCSAVTETLLAHYDGELIPPYDRLGPDGRIEVAAKHATLDEMLADEWLHASELDRVTVFTTVRNPFDYWPSEWLRQRAWAVHLDDPDHWINRVAGARNRAERAWRHDFPGFLRHELGMRPASLPRRGLANLVKRGRLSLLPPERHLHARFLVGASRALRQDRLAAELAALMRELGFAAKESMLERNVNPSRERDYRMYYDRTSYRLVARVFRPDLERFGFRF